MLTAALKALIRFDWCHNDISSRPDTALLADVYWWERREDVGARIEEIENTIDSNIPRDERYFCYAYAAMSVGDKVLYEQYAPKIESNDILSQWLNIETQGRGREYARQAKTVETLLIEQDELPDWAATACFASLNHNGLDPKPLLTVLTRKPISTALSALLTARLIAAVGKPNEACNILEQAHEKWPNCAAILWFHGLLLAQIAKTAQAIQLVDRAESMGLIDMTVLRFWLGSITSAPRNITSNDIMSIYSRIEHYVQDDLRQSGEMASCLIIRYWMEGDLVSAHQLLQKYHTFQSMEERKEDRASQIFMRYAVYLCVSWQHNRQFYNQPTPSDLLYVFGESHSLTSSNIIFSWLGKSHKATTCFMMGIKMWHLADPQMTRYKLLLQDHLASLQDNVPLLFTIGEIDCRPDEGIWKIHKKTGRKLQGLITKTVNGYLDYLKQTLTNRIWASVTISGIPAPAYSLEGKRETGDTAGFLNMIAEVNRQLKEGALNRGFNFLDVYAATVNEEGVSNKAWHLDGWHLQPVFYTQAENWLCLTPERLVRFD
jgi:hypothetical protein